MKHYRTYEMKNNISAARKALGLNQSDLALICGTTQNTISAIETGKYGPSFYLAAIICDTLQVPFEKMFYYYHEGVKCPVFEDRKLTPADLIAEKKREIEMCKKIDAWNKEESALETEEEMFRITTMSPYF